MKKETPQTENHIRKAEPVKTGDLDKAIERIYRKYGGDLQAFFRDANKEPAIDQHEDAEPAQVETYAL